MDTTSLTFDTVAALSSIQSTVRALSEKHLEQQYTSAHCGPTLHDLISSALHSLSQCINIINSRAPISRLPEDVLGAISLAVKDGGPFGASSILRLSHVSRLWHRATQSPLLWTSVELAAQSTHGLARASLLRSKNLPIDLRISWGPGGLWAARSSKTLCTVLDPHIARCRSIAIRGSGLPWPLLSEFKRVFRTADVPLLESLSVHIDSYLGAEASPGEAVFPHAPRLVRVTLDHSALETLCPPMGNVRFLCIEYGGRGYAVSSALFGLLAVCPMLETLAVSAGVSCDRAPESEKLSLPRLRSLSLHEHYGDSPLFEFLPHITAPNLSRLFIDGCNIHTFYDLRDHVQMGPLSFPSLKVLVVSLTCSDVDSTKVLKMASEYFPYVEELTINPKNHNSRCMLESMIEIRALPGWPCLQRVSLGDIPSLEGCDYAV